jgi:MFS family permease
MSAADPLKTGRPLRIVGLMAALLASVFAFQLNASMLSPVLVTMQRELNATSAQIALTQTAFFTSAALFSLFLPRLGDLVGRRRVMLVMLGGAVLGGVVAALAPNVAVLFIGRVVQGLAGPIVPLSLIMLRVEVPQPKRYATLMAVLTSVNGGIGGGDAILGGWLAHTVGFRTVFWVMVAVAILATVLVATNSRDSVSETTPPMDWKGVGLLVIVLGTILTAFNQAGEPSTADWGAIGTLLVVGVVAALLFCRVESRSAHPLVPMRYLRSRSTWPLLLTTLLTMTGVFAVMNGIIPQLAQDTEVGAGVPAETVSFLTLTPYALAGLVMGPLAGALAGRFGYVRVLRIGLLCTGGGLLLAIYVVGNPAGWALLALSILIGITYAGVANIMLNGLGIVLSPADNQGYLPGLNSGMFNLGAGLSFAILYAVMTATGANSPAHGYLGGIVTGAIIVTAASFVSLLIPKPADDIKTSRVENSALEPSHDR